MIRGLLKAFRQEVLPRVSQTEQALRIVAVLLLLLAGGWLMLAIGWRSLMYLLIIPAIVVVLGVVTAILLTWNDEWANFWVVEHNGKLIACAKLRRYTRYSLLHDLFVLPEWRSQKVGSHLVAHVGKEATKPLYLTCLPTLMQFYLRLGFIPVSPKSLSPLLQYDLGLAGRVSVVPLMLK
jgi:N-acetylglutamate synthase-like GNAT family acetyltransferase